MRLIPKGVHTCTASLDGNGVVVRRTAGVTLFMDVLELWAVVCKLVLCVQNSYQPTEVCEGLWIVPDWCEPPDCTALNIRMAPGLAFGTGKHPCWRVDKLTPSRCLGSAGKPVKSSSQSSIFFAVQA